MLILNINGSYSSIPNSLPSLTDGFAVTKIRIHDYDCKLLPFLTIKYPCKIAFHTM